MCPVEYRSDWLYAADLTSQENILAADLIEPSSTPNFRRISDLKGIPDGVDFIRLDSGSGHVDGLFKRLASSKSLVVLFPAALPLAALKAQQFPYIPRWQWVASMPVNVWCFEEALARKYQIAAGWFQEGDHFYADTIARIIRDIAAALEIEAGNITLMGSSLGGFGALMVAAAIPGCRAIADIAQTDLHSYQFRHHVEDLCIKIYGTNDVDGVNAMHRDRFSVIERFRALGHVPDMTILHDITDEPNGRQQIYPFFVDLAALQTESPNPFMFEAILRSTARGHVALHRGEMLPILYRAAGIRV